VRQLFNRENISEEHIAWHPAFVEAIQAELEEYKDVLEFQAEYPLTTEPLRIDVLIVRKRADVVIRKNIARIFREYNIIEYKSPDDYVSLSDFQKVQSYAWLYASLHDVPTQNTVKGMPMPVQMIESKKLSAWENMWLKNLRATTDAESLAEMLHAVRKRGKGAPLKAYAYALFTAAKSDAMKEVKKMATTMEIFEIFRDVFGFDEEWEEKTMEKGRKEEQIKMAKNLLAYGVDPVIIAKSSGLALDKIQKLAL
jgi:hypothetical protein